MIRFVLPALLFCLPSFAAVVDLTTAGASTNTAVWNTGLAQIHAPLRAENGDAGADSPVDLGDGSDGPFNADTYASFDTDGDADNQIILLDSTRVYEFSSFELEAGWTLTSTGANAIRIRVQGEASIAGTIDLSGEDGETGTADTTLQASGGTACCGGGSGGDGGIQGAGAGTAGVGAAVNGNGTGGGGSAAVLRAGGGGGGAAHSQNGGDGEFAGGGGGAAGLGGTMYVDYVLSNLRGGSGGGGGGVYTGGGAATNAAGSGGGAGGGALSFVAGGSVEILSSALLDFRGGDGGGRVENVRSNGAGGGGSGGGGYFFAAQGLQVAGNVLATGGDGGAGTPGIDQDTDGRDDGEGGNGSSGILWAVIPTGNLLDIINGGTWNPPTANPGLTTAGTAEYRIGTFTATSSVIDTQVPSPVFNQITVDDTVPAGSSLTYEVAGSSDAFATDDSGFVPIADVQQLSGKQYLKFRVTMQNGNAASTPVVNRIEYSFISNEYQFSLAGCARVARPAQGSTLGGIIFWLGLLLLPWGSRAASSGWRRITRQ